MQRRFTFHGIYLLVVALAAVFYNPHTEQFGFNPEAKTALIAGGIFALISFLWAYLSARGSERTAIVGGFTTTLILLASFLGRAIPSWISFAHGDWPKWFAASMISLMIVASLPLFWALLFRLKR